MKICSVGAELLHADEQIDVMKLIVTFRKNSVFFPLCRPVSHMVQP